MERNAVPVPREIRISSSALNIKVKPVNQPITGFFFQNKSSICRFLPLFLADKWRTVGVRYREEMILDHQSTGTPFIPLTASKIISSTTTRSLSDQTGAGIVNFPATSRKIRSFSEEGRSHRSRPDRSILRTPPVCPAARILWSGRIPPFPRTHWLPTNRGIYLLFYEQYCKETIRRP